MTRSTPPARTTATSRCAGPSACSPGGRTRPAHDSALEDYERVLDIEYNNVDALYAIADIWRRRADAQRLVECLHMIADRAESLLQPEHIVANYRELGTVYQDTLNQPYDAIEAWRKLLAIDPRDFDAMAALGAHWERDGKDAVIVKGTGLFGLIEPKGPIDCGNSGTTMRLLSGILVAQPFATTLIGDASLTRRPMKRIFTPLRERGARRVVAGDAHVAPCRQTASC